MMANLQKDLHSIGEIIFYGYLNLGIVTIPATFMIIAIIKYMKRLYDKRQNLNWLEYVADTVSEIAISVNRKMQKANNKYFTGEEEETNFWVCVQRLKNGIKRVNSILVESKTLSGDDIACMGYYTDSAIETIKEMRFYEEEITQILNRMLDEDEVIKRVKKEERERARRERGEYERKRFEKAQKEQERKRQQQSQKGRSANLDMFDTCKTKEEVVKRYRQMAKILHPDAPRGSNAKFQTLQEQYQSALQRVS